MKAKILEIFDSIQGEGKYAGVKQVFVRFFECNMHCIWCDTPLSIGSKALRPEVARKFPEGSTDRFEEFTEDELLEKVQNLWDGHHSVSLTGGEPLLQWEFLRGFLPKLKEANIPTYLETNGILPEELSRVIDGVDIIAMDFKLPSSTKTKGYWQEHEAFLKLAVKKDVFIKTVVTSDTKEEDLFKAVDLVKRTAPQALLIVQPNTYEINNGAMAKSLAFQEECLKQLKNVRLIPQIHKFMKIR